MYNHSYLTFRHWSGVTPYTSSYEFAGSCVFVKQSPGNLSLRPSPTFAFRASKHYTTQTHNLNHAVIRHSTCKSRAGQALSRSYGRFFAEFLKDLSLVRLGLLDLPTCVSLWYRSIFIKYRTGFSRKPQCYSVFFRRLHFKWLRPPV